ncbi:MAG: hypothetical protein JOZ05_13225 [Acetobacteraceae bacterium]|nr:hypothetical protein [Acetobacteraceae bacterium]
MRLLHRLPRGVRSARRRPVCAWSWTRPARRSWWTRCCTGAGRGLRALAGGQRARAAGPARPGGADGGRPARRTPPRRGGTGWEGAAGRGTGRGGIHLYRRPTGPGLYDAIVVACGAAGFSPSVVQEAPRLPATLSLVAAGLGISVVPASMRRLAVAGVTYRELDACPGLSAPLHLTLRRTGLTAAVARFRAVVRRRADRPSG